MEADTEELEAVPLEPAEVAIVTTAEDTFESVDDEVVLRVSVAIKLVEVAFTTSVELAEVALIGLVAELVVESEEEACWT